MQQTTLLRAYIDADVLFRAATASHEYTAALVLLRMAEFTLLDTVTAAFTIDEARRNLSRFLPAQTPLFMSIVARAVRIVDDPPPKLLQAYREQAHWKDVVNLAAAIHANAHLLITYNERRYLPDTQAIQVLTPGQFIRTARLLLFGNLAQS